MVPPHDAVPERHDQDVLSALPGLDLFAGPADEDTVPLGTWPDLARPAALAAKNDTERKRP